MGKRTIRPDNETLLELSKNYSAREIGEHYGVDKSTVYNWYRQAGIKKNPKFQPDNALFSELSTTEIANLYGVDKGTVRCYRKKHGLPMVDTRKVLPSNEELLQLLKKHSFLEVAEMYDVSTYSIKKRLKNANKCEVKHQSDIAGRKFGKLTALEPTNQRSCGHIIWKCQCDCGNIAFVDANRLKKGNTQSCGCLRTARDFTRAGVLDRLIQKGYSVEPFGRYGILFVNGEEVYGLQLQIILQEACRKGLSKEELDNMIIAKAKMKIDI